MNLEFENLNRENELKVNPVGEFYFDLIKENVRTEELSAVDNNNPLIVIPYKLFTNKDYFDLSYKQIIFEPSGEADKYRVMTRNGLVISKGKGLFDTYFTPNRNGSGSEFNLQNLPNFYDSNIKSIFYNESVFNKYI